MMLNTIDSFIQKNPASLDFEKLLASHPDLNIDQKDYNINVTANYGKILTAQEVTEEFRNFQGQSLPAHLYFHIPVCSYICHFCNYVKRLASKKVPLEETMNEWVELLQVEASLHLKNAPWLHQAAIESIYFGGGTAALMSPQQINRMLTFINANYQLSKNCEISLEGNPDNFTSDYIKSLIDVGCNRFSVGIQSLQDEVLKFTNRGHSAADAINSIENLLKSGVPFNADIMFGLPHQTPDFVEADIKKLVSLGVPTITIYRLRNSDRAGMGIGNKSAWNNQKIQEKFQKLDLFPSLSKTYQMRKRIVDTLLDQNYYPSPCGWWSKKNAYPNDGNIPQVSHNKWEKLHSMLAYGPGAYGWLTGDSNKIIQTHNMSDINSYQDHMRNSSSLPLAFGRELTSYQAIATRLGFAFKANQPIYLDLYQELYQVDLMTDPQTAAAIKHCLDNKFLEYNSKGKFLKPTLIGEALHEEIISEVIHRRIGGSSEIICKR